MASRTACDNNKASPGRIRPIAIASMIGFASLVPLGATSAENYLEMDLEQLLQVTVTGSTLRDESLKTVPSVVTVFTHDQIAALGMDYLYELLTLVPEYQANRLADSGVNYSFSARGRRNAAQVHEVLLMVDGRRFTNPRSGGSDILVPLFPLAQIERVEVISGPGSALYGSSAFTGVINIITRKQQSEVSIAVGSDDRRSMDVLWGKESGDWEASVFAHAYEDSGQPFALRDISSNIPVASSDPVTSLNLDMGLRYKQTQMRFTYNRTDAADFYSVERIHNNFNHNRLGFTQLNLEQGFALADNIKSNLSFSYSIGEQLIHAELADEGDLFELSEPPSQAPMLADAVLNSDSYQLALANDWSINETTSSQFGVELREDTETKASLKTNYDSIAFIARDFPITSYEDMDYQTPLSSEGSQRSLGVYGQFLRQMSDKTNLTLGLRYDNYKHIGDHFSPRMGVVHQLTDHQTLKLLYGEAFRAPTLSEIGLINNTRLVGNPDLTHELVKTWDLVWMGTWQHTSLSLNGFYSVYEQPIIAGLKGTTRTYINGDSEHSNGVSLEASQQLAAHWLARMTYSHFLDLPDSAFREADQLTSLMLNYKMQAWNWNLTAVYQDETQTLAATDIPSVNTRNTLDDFWVVNSKLGYQLTPAVGINLQIKNLLDKEYFSPAQGNGIAYGIPNRGRETSMEVEFRF